MRLKVLLLLAACFIASYAKAEEVYRDCGQLDLQDDPGIGIGIDLSMNHLSSAAKYRNGTYSDLYHLEGSTEYRLLMERLLRSAAETGAGHPELQQTLWPTRIEAPCQTKWRHAHPYLAYVQDQFPILQPYLGQPLVEAPLNETVEILKRELILLKTKSESALGMPINTTTISYPSLVRTLGRAYDLQILESFQEAGFETWWQWHGVTLDLLASFLKLNSCPGQHFTECDRQETIFGIEYSDDVFALSKSTLQGSMSELEDSQEFLRADTTTSLQSDDTETRWYSSVKQALQSYIDRLQTATTTTTTTTNTIEHVIIFGAASHDPPFQQIVRGLLQKHDLSSKTIWIDEVATTPPFAAARGAALRSKAKLAAGCIDCFPMPACLLPEEHPFYNYNDRAEHQKLLERRNITV